MPDPPRAEISLKALVKAWLANLVLASVDYGVSFSCGGIALAVALFFDMPNPHWWAVVGALLPLGPLGLMATSRRGFKAELAMLHELHEQGHITENEYEIYRGRVLQSRADRLQGHRIAVGNAKLSESTPLPEPAPSPESKPKKSPGRANKSATKSEELPPTTMSTSAE
jgi:hypothetical protein